MTPSTLADLVRASKLDWMLTTFDDEDRSMGYLRQALTDASQEARRRRQEFLFSESDMVAMAATHFQKVEAFLQALGTTRSPQMLVMVSRILAGASIQQVTMSYAAQQNFQLQVILATPYGETDSPYESTNINDAGLLRHFGIMTMNGQPLFDGFYALHLGLEETPA